MTRVLAWWERRHASRARRYIATHPRPALAKEKP